MAEAYDSTNFQSVDCRQFQDVWAFIEDYVSLPKKLGFGIDEIQGLLCSRVKYLAELFFHDYLNSLIKGNEDFNDYLEDILISLFYMHQAEPEADSILIHLYEEFEFGFMEGEVPEIPEALFYWRDYKLGHQHDRLFDSIKPLSKKTGHSLSTANRNAFIYSLLKFASNEFNINITKNDETNANTICACDLVSSLLKHYGSDHLVRSDAIKKIYYSTAKLLKHADKTEHLDHLDNIKVYFARAIFMDSNPQGKLIS